MSIFNIFLPDRGSCQLSSCMKHCWGFFVFRGDLSVTLSIPNFMLQWPVYFFYSAFSNQAMTSFIFRRTAIQPNKKSRHFMQNPSDFMSEAGQPKSHSLINRLFNRLMLEWNEINSGHLFVRFWYFLFRKSFTHSKFIYME